MLLILLVFRKRVMFELTGEQLTAVGATLAVLFGALGLLLGRIVDNWIKLRRSKIQDRFDVQKIDLLEEKQLQDGLKFAIKKLDKQNSNLERRIDFLQHQYNRCIEEHTRSETMCELLNEKLEEVTKKMEEYRNMLRIIRNGKEPSPGLLGQKSPTFPVTPVPPPD